MRRVSVVLVGPSGSSSLRCCTDFSSRMVVWGLKVAGDRRGSRHHSNQRDTDLSRQGVACGLTWTPELSKLALGQEHDRCLRRREEKALVARRGSKSARPHSPGHGAQSPASGLPALPAAVGAGLATTREAGGSRRCAAHRVTGAARTEGLPVGRSLSLPGARGNIVRTRAGMGSGPTNRAAGCAWQLFPLSL